MGHPRRVDAATSVGEFHREGSRVPGADVPRRQIKHVIVRETRCERDRQIQSQRVATANAELPVPLMVGSEQSCLSS